MIEFFLKAWLKTCIVLIVIVLFLSVVFFIPATGAMYLFNHGYSVAGFIVGFIITTFWLTVISNSFEIVDYIQHRMNK